MPVLATKPLNWFKVAPQARRHFDESELRQLGRKTDRPSAELLLGVMKTISVSVVEVNAQIHVLLSPLTKVQQRLLELWDLPPALYDKVARGFLKPPEDTSER